MLISFRHLALLALLALLVIGPIWGPDRAQAEAVAASQSAVVAVIAHPDVTQDTLTRDDLLDFFTGDQQQWSDGTQVVIKEMKTRGTVRSVFYDFIGQRPSRLKSIWLRNMLSGEGGRPESLGSATEMIECVAGTPGAIGFVDATMARAEHVKTLILIPSDKQ